MKIAAIQSDIVWEEPESNFARLAPKIAQSVELGARLVLLPEMFGTGFSMATSQIAEPEGGPSEEFLKTQALRNRIWIGGSCPVADGSSPRPFNRFLLVSPDGKVAHYDKIHPFGFGGEADHYARGSKTFTFEVDDLRCTPFICYDLRFADRFWESAEQTDCYVVVANWPAARQEHWKALIKARAIENLAYVIGVNRVGSGDGIAYEGGSLVVDPFGEVLAEAGSQEKTLSVEVERARVQAVRSNYPFLMDR
jgi:predicted amidohydrolase